MPPFEAAHHSTLGGLDYVAIAIWVVLFIITVFMFYSLNRSAGEIMEKMSDTSKELEALSADSDRINSLLKEV